MNKTHQVGTVTMAAKFRINSDGDLEPKLRDISVELTPSVAKDFIAELLEKGGAITLNGTTLCRIEALPLDDGFDEEDEGGD